MGNLGKDVKETAEEHTKRTAARGIIKEIEKWTKDKPEKAAKRWSFELIQNAVDTAKKYGKEVEIEIKLVEGDENKCLIFKHNGGPFSYDELCAIIYGGTTKTRILAPEEKYIGQFGTGFLVTHVLSKNVKIKGIGVDKDTEAHHFEIDINRDSEKEDDIVSEINKCFQQLENTDPISKNSDKIYTEIIYELKSENQREAAKVGLEILEKLVLFILSLNEEITKITINNQTFTKIKENIDTNLSKILILEGTEKSQDEILLYTSPENDIKIGVVIKNNEIVNLSNDIPRLFVYMPLIGSEVIPIPFIINSYSFEPSEERDALLLAGDDEDVKQNKKLLEKAFDCFFKLAEFCVQKEYKQLYNLFHFSKISEEYLTQKEKYWKFWKEIIEKTISKLQELEIIKTEEGYKKPFEVIFPIPYIKEESYFNILIASPDLTEEEFNQFYEIIRSIKKPLPIKETVFEWQKIIRFWKNIDSEINLKVYPIIKLCEEIKRASINENELKEILKKLFELFDKLYKKKKIEAYFVDGLLLDENFSLRPKEFLIPDINSKHVRETLSRKKEEIPDKIKDLSKKIAYDIRAILLDRDFSEFNIVKDFIKEEIDVDEIIDKFLKNYAPQAEEKIDFNNERYKGWGELFIWCIINNKIREGFPVFTKGNTVKIINKIHHEPYLLFPFQEMDIDCEYEELIPESKILNIEYFNLIDEKDREEFKKKLIENKICYENIIFYVKKLKIKKEKLKKILVNDDIELKSGEHEITIDEGNISTIHFWPEIIGRISHVPERAKKFFYFLLNVVCKKDMNWRKEIEVSCSCGKSHKIIPCEWLANIKCDSWVPIQKSDEEEQFVAREATKENIEKLLSTEKINEIIKSDIGIKFLSHFGFDVLDLEIKHKSIESNIPENKIRKEIAQVVRNEKLMNIIIKYPNELEEIASYPEELPKIISQLKENKEKTKIIEENTKTGWFVEEIIKEILKEKEITHITPMYSGADIEIWPEDEGWDGGRINMKPYFIEIKFTTSKRVRLSKTQAKMAEEEKTHYFVLIIKGDKSLKEKITCYFNSLSSEEKDEIKSYIEKYSYIVSNISEKLAKTPSPEEVEPDINGYWIKEKLWAQGEKFTEWLLKR